MRLLPIVAAEPCFALKGGTAINLFVRDLPRLSVDIDLIYLPVHGRSESLGGISAGLLRIENTLITAVPGARSTRHTVETAIVRLVVRANGVQVKIECSPVLRGTVNETSTMHVTEKVESLFGFAETTVVSFDDLYAGKLVAALDRQHPRDLFDVRGLLDDEGITDGLRIAFLIYLLSHNRPMGEVLSGRLKDLEPDYRGGFEGMTQAPVSLKILVDTQHDIVDLLIAAMPEPHRRFLVAFEAGKPDWSLLGFAEAPDLPAIRWREKNLNQIPASRRRTLVSLLTDSLSRQR